MKIEARLFATLREDRGKKVDLDLPAGSSPRDVLRALAIAEPDVAILLVNGRDADPLHALADGDVVSLFPPVGGG